ncbi:MAG TPA: ATP-binding protein, partial [Micromonosporaceae bacterium]
PEQADRLGLGQLTALDSLMRANEEASASGAVLVALAGRLPMPATLLPQARTADQQYRDQVRLFLTSEQTTLVETVVRGAAGQRFEQLADALSGGVDATAGNPAMATPVSEVLTAALSYTGLRRLAQDRIAREIASAAQDRAETARAIAVTVMAGASVLFAIVLGMGVVVSRSIAAPLRRLTEAARAVAEVSQAELVRVADSDRPDPAPPQIAAVTVDRDDEIGELAAAVNRVQATAALLLERQVSSRRNIAVMFANIARRTQNLVGRQRALIADLASREHDPDLSERVSRLDHVATRLRRSADSLLVVSGTIDQSMTGIPTPLPDVVEDALADLENAGAVVVGEVCQVAIAAGVTADLRLLLAELLDNATNFSPPGARIDVVATFDPSAGTDPACRVTIVDHGVGMSPARLADENRRLVERERLDVAPTSVLGLFVVGRLARRHGLGVRLHHTEGRGVTATVSIPSRCLSPGPVLVRTRDRRPDRRAAAVLAPRAVPAIERLATGSFAWFTPPPPHTPPPHTPAPPAMGTPTNEPEVTASNLAQVNGSLVAPPRRPGPDLTAPLSRPAPDLARRIPGTHMAEGVRAAPVEADPVRSPRDPEAERDAINDFLSGLARGSATAPVRSGPPSSSISPERPS